MKLRFLFLLFYCITSEYIYSQIQCDSQNSMVFTLMNYSRGSYMGENALGNYSIKLNNAIILGGSSAVDKIHKASVKKVDTTGQTIWSTAIWDCDSSKQSFIDKMILLADTTIYATYATNSHNYSNKETYQIWKIDSKNGKIKWKTTLDTVHRLPDYILDYNDSLILVTYSKFYNNYGHLIDLVLISKNNGKIKAKKYLGFTPWANYNYSLQIQPNKALYYTLKDTLVKTSSDTAFQIQWKKRLPTNARSFQKMFRRGDKFYFLGTDGFDPLWVSCDTFGNNVTSNARLLVSDSKAGNIIETNKHVFVSWDWINTGYKSMISKIELATGKEVWSKFYKYEDDYQGTTNDLLIDKNGDLILTGESGSGATGTRWAFAKIDTTTGNEIISKNLDINSAGVYLFKTNQAVFSVGDKFTSGSNMLKIDTKNFEVVASQVIKDCQCPSNAIDNYLNKPEELMVYPNPTFGKVTIATVNQKMINYELLSVSGFEIEKGSIDLTSTNELDFSNLSSGIYFLKISNNDNSKIVKLVMQ